MTTVMTDSAPMNGVAPPWRAESSLRAARVAVAAIFFLNGTATANWLVRIPAVQEKLGLSEGSLGLALFGVAVGALVSMPWTGRLVARFGSRRVTQIAAFIFAGVFLLPPLAPNALALFVALVVLGAGHGALDVAMNAQAATVERQYARPIMSSFHALFSLGGLVGATMGGVIASRGVGLMAHLAALSFVAALLAGRITSRMLPPGADATSDHAAATRPRGVLVALGVLAFCVLLGEGAMADWSAVYLRDVTRAGPGLAAAGYAAFSLAMASGRLVGDSLRLMVSSARLVRLGGVIAASGLAVALTLDSPWAAILGFGTVGVGLSIAFPIALAAASALPGVAPGPAIATVSTFGYAGFLAGPPLIGFVAEATSLRGGLVVVVVSCVVVAALAGGLRWANGPGVQHHQEPSGETARAAA
jgi:predicted MFS family arabinose efflux permease